MSLTVANCSSSVIFGTLWADPTHCFQQFQPGNYAFGQKLRPGKKEWEVVEPILAWNTLSLMVMLPFSSFMQAPGSSNRGSLNLKILSHPSSRQVPAIQYCENKLSTIWQRKTWTSLSRFCWTISAWTIRSNLCPEPVIWHSEGSRRLYAHICTVICQERSSRSRSQQARDREQSKSERVICWGSTMQSIGQTQSRLALPYRAKRASIQQATFNNTLV
jgi:hypothetical protein